MLCSLPDISFDTHSTVLKSSVHCYVHRIDRLSREVFVNEGRVGRDRVRLLTQTAQQLESVLQERVQLDGFVEGLDSFRLPLRLHVHLAQ